MLLRVVFGVAGIISAFYGVVLAGSIAWREFQRLAYLSRLDEWAEDVTSWQ